MGYFYIRHKIYSHYYKFIASKLFIKLKIIQFLQNLRASFLLQAL